MRNTELESTKRRMNKSLFALFILFLSTSVAIGQTQLSLIEVLNKAQNNSLAAFIQKNMYLASHWSHQSYLADHLPELNLSLTPLNYNRSFISRYNSENNQDEYREQQSLSSYAKLSLQQKVSSTGGTIFLDSDFSRLENFDDPSYKSFTSTPVRIGISQPLFAYNSFKWKSKIEPLKFEKAKRKYISNVQKLNLKAVQLFFDLARWQINLSMAESDFKNAGILYEIAEKRMEIATIEKNELLNLELNVLNAKVKLAQAKKDKQQAEFELKLFLALDTQSDISLKLPEKLLNLDLNLVEVLAYAKKNHPDILSWEQENLEANQNLDKSQKARRFQMNLNMSYGLNQKADSWDDSYKNPLDQQKVSVGVEIPILDWGKRKGAYKMAINNREITRLNIKQKELDFEQAINRLVIDFNFQTSLVNNAKRAHVIATQAYSISLERFKQAKLSVLQLDTALAKQNSAWQNYIESLQSYWVYYYKIQEFSHYDFVRQQNIDQNFEELIR